METSLHRELKRIYAGEARGPKSSSSGIASTRCATDS